VIPLFIRKKTGSVRVELKFEKSLAAALTLILYYETQELIAIDQFRQVGHPILFYGHYFTSFVK
jgi:hypothetical protein